MLINHTVNYSQLGDHYIRAVTFRKSLFYCWRQSNQC